MTGGHANLNSGSVYNPFLDAEMHEAGVKHKNHRSLSNSICKFNQLGSYMTNCSKYQSPGIDKIQFVINC